MWGDVLGIAVGAATGALTIHYTARWYMRRLWEDAMQEEAKMLTGLAIGCDECRRKAELR